ncbi:MAG: fibronectin type III domain-containing protein [Chloroflexi bacterium]|nr:fibronectin type III domain-containing protein [Chloroflexota bacterium]
MIVMLLLLLPMPASGQIPPSFIITNADATTYVTTTLTMPIPDIPSRFVVQYANGMRFYSVPPISSTLLTLMGQVSERFVIQYANADRFYGFTYPVGMISDTVPPQITGTVTCITGATDTITVSWMTNEYADGAVLYGTLAGVYTRTVSNPLYFKLHTFTLNGLRFGIDYHYVVSDTDRSGNSFLSPEYTCTIPAPPPPNSPSSLNATAVSETQINLTWQDNSSDETDFHVERSPDGIGWTGIYTASVNTSSCEPTVHIACSSASASCM